LKELQQRGSLPSFVKLVGAVRCEGNVHLKEFFNKIVAGGGEGVMLREPQSLYTGGRSPSLRKYKVK
jgi:ATP-dependent DNA ligase